MGGVTPPAKVCTLMAMRPMMRVEKRANRYQPQSITLKYGRVGDERRASSRKPVSHLLSPNRTCNFRYASGFPEVMAKSGGPNPNFISHVNAKLGFLRTLLEDITKHPKAWEEKLVKRTREVQTMDIEELIEKRIESRFSEVWIVCKNESERQKDLTIAIGFCCLTEMDPDNWTR